MVRPPISSHKSIKRSAGICISQIDFSSGVTPLAIEIKLQTLIHTRVQTKTPLAKNMQGGFIRLRSNLKAIEAGLPNLPLREPA